MYTWPSACLSSVENQDGNIPPCSTADIHSGTSDIITNYDYLTFQVQLIQLERNQYMIFEDGIYGVNSQGLHYMMDVKYAIISAIMTKLLPKEIGNTNLHPRFNNRSILSLGKVHLVVIKMNKNKSYSIDTDPKHYAHT